MIDFPRYVREIQPFKLRVNHDMISDKEHAENAFSKGHNSFKIKDTAITLTFFERYYLFLSFETKITRIRCKNQNLRTLIKHNIFHHAQ